jgi:hypothetical protein
MAIASAGIKSGSTTYAVPSDGSAITLAVVGTSLDSAIASPTADTNYLTKRTYEFSVKDAKPSSTAPNGYTQQRATCVFKAPFILDNGNRTVNTVRIEFACDIELTVAEKYELLLQASQLLGDTDFQGFWTNLSLN